ncbi:JmjC domain-containing protein [Streptantibioticus silvisoli]|uniref:Cupin domain-containing protein n=1 Tax=Streptantibioticus silvisoli TaxID=2705255 RepID=A0ABT6VVA8_9ACTN|nr:cupin domain-containing protein [Streptantibioticus silvisoli]MDI5962411.1 cupin domain-containing protein [Streptantibioticus silvisoli]
MTTHPSDLARLIDPLTVGEFFDKHWQGVHHVSHGPLERLTAIPGVAEIGTDVEQALERYRGPIMVYGDAVTEEAEGLSERMLVPHEEALDWLHKGANLEMDFADMYLPRIRRLVGRLRTELGLPEGTLAKAILYSGEGGAGLEPHFDAYCNFVLQLGGRKTWRVGPNTHVVNAVQHYDAFEAPYLPDELASYWTGGTVDVDPPVLEEVELTAGSLLFMPRGEWHATSSSETSLALNLTFGQPSWLDLLLTEIRARLVKSPNWRALATAPGGAPWQSEQESRALLTEALGELRTLGGAIEPDDVFGRHNAGTDRYSEIHRALRQILRLPG